METGTELDQSRGVEVRDITTVRPRNPILYTETEVADMMRRAFNGKTVGTKVASNESKSAQAF